VLGKEMAEAGMNARLSNGLLNFPGAFLRTPAPGFNRNLPLLGLHLYSMGYTETSPIFS